MSKCVLTGTLNTAQQRSLLTKVEQYSLVYMDTMNIPIVCNWIVYRLCTLGAPPVVHSYLGE